MGPLSIHPILRESLDHSIFINIFVDVTQGDFNCGASSQADFILNCHLSNSPFPPSPAGRLGQSRPPWCHLTVFIWKSKSEREGKIYTKNEWLPFNRFNLVDSNINIFCGQAPVKNDTWGYDLKVNATTRVQVRCCRRRLDACAMLTSNRKWVKRFLACTMKVTNNLLQSESQIEKWLVDHSLSTRLYTILYHYFQEDGSSSLCLWSALVGPANTYNWRQVPLLQHIWVLKNGSNSFGIQWYEK